MVTLLNRRFGKDIMIKTKTVRNPKTKNKEIYTIYRINCGIFLSLPKNHSWVLNIGIDDYLDHECHGGISYSSNYLPSSVFEHPGKNYVLGYQFNHNKKQCRVCKTAPFASSIFANAKKLLKKAVLTTLNQGKGFIITSNKQLHYQKQLSVDNVDNNSFVWFENVTCSLLLGLGLFILVSILLFLHFDEVRRKKAKEKIKP